MRKLPLIAAAIFLSITQLSVAQPTAASSRIVSAADAFLSTLDAAQRQAVLYDFNDNVQRARWSNFPTGFVPRSGVNFKQMTVPQRDAAMKLLAAVLSPMGLEKVEQIRQADDDFKANGSARGPGGRGGSGGRGPGGPPPEGQNGPPPGLAGGGPDGRGGRGRRGGGGDMFGSDLYYFSFLGKPSIDRPLDASVRRSSSRAQYHLRRNQRRAHAHAHRCTASRVPIEWEDHSPYSEGRATKRSL